MKTCYLVSLIGLIILFSLSSCRVVYKQTSPRNLSRFAVCNQLDSCLPAERMKSAAILEGIVTDEAGNVPANVQLYLVSKCGLNQKILLSPDGEYQLKIPRNTTCVLQASAGGYKNQFIEFSSEGWEEGDVYTADFLLLRLTPK